MTFCDVFRLTLALAFLAGFGLAPAVGGAGQDVGVGGDVGGPCVGLAAETLAGTRALVAVDPRPVVTPSLAVDSSAPRTLLADEGGGPLVAESRSDKTKVCLTCCSRRLLRCLELSDNHSLCHNTFYRQCAGACDAEGKAPAEWRCWPAE